MKRIVGTSKARFDRLTTFRRRASLRRAARQATRVRRPRERILLGPYVHSAPRRFSLDASDAYAVVDFARSVRDGVLRQHESVVLDFSATEKMVADGTLLLVAELHRCILLCRKKPSFSFIPPRNEKVLEVLKQVGILDLIGAELEATATSDDVIHWCAAHGRRADGTQAGQLLDRVQGQIAEPLKQGLFAGITEAMMNAGEHAYSKPRPDGIAKPPEVDWWLFSQEKDGWLSVFICDLGVGIPGTLPDTTSQSPSLNSRVRRLLGSANADVKMIKLALERGRSRTKLDHRGYGLFRDIRGAISEKRGELLIISNRGRYGLVQQGQGSPDLIAADTLPISIGGTIVGWRVPIGQSQ